MPEREQLEVFGAMERLLQEERDLKELLVLLPESQGGLLPVAMGLMSRNPKIQDSTASAGVTLVRVQAPTVRV